MDLSADRLTVLRAAAMFDGVSPALVVGPLVVIAGRAMAEAAPGFDADIIAVDGNPLDDPAAIRRLRAVYTGGRAIHPALGSRASIEVP